MTTDANTDATDNTTTDANASATTDAKETRAGELDTTSVVCNGKGCREKATYRLLWNNPKLHEPDRRKSWLACDDHLQWLTHFLSIRGFLKDTVPFEQLTDQPADRPDLGLTQSWAAESTTDR